MLTYSTYSEAGGVGKTTTAANLAVAHARAGLKPLVVPLDPQDGDLSGLLGVSDNRSNNDVETLVHHLVARNENPFSNLIRTVEHGVDIVPEHNRLESIGDVLRNEQEARGEFGDSFPIYTQLQRVLREAGVGDDYDVVIVDPPASPGPLLYNGLDATRNLVMPIEPSAKGTMSISGLDDLVAGLKREIDISVSALVAVPNKIKGTNDQEAVLAEVRDLGYDVPVVLKDRTSLFGGCWNEQCSAFRYIERYRDRRRDYELETLAKLDRLARHIEQTVGMEAPNPPEPGALDLDDDTEHEVEARR